MLYLLDANVLIRAHQDYYPLDRLRGFWDWIRGQAEAGNVKMPFEMHQEVVAGTDELATWIGQPDVYDALRLDDEVDENILQRVLDHGYGTKLPDACDRLHVPWVTDFELYRALDFRLP